MEIVNLPTTNFGNAIPWDNKVVIEALREAAKQSCVYLFTVNGPERGDATSGDVRKFFSLPPEYHTHNNGFFAEKSKNCNARGEKPAESE